MARHLTVVPDPCLEDDYDGPDIECLDCMDSGEIRTPFSDVLIPCVTCRRGDYSWRQEQFDEMGRDR